MKEWSLKFYENQDWITAVFFFNFLIIALLHWKFKSQFQRLFYFLKMDSYLTSYFNDQIKFIFQPFNIGGFLIVASSLMLWLYFLLESAKGFQFYLFEFFYVALLMMFLIIVRIFFVEGVFRVIGNQNEIKQSLFKLFTYNILLGILLLVLLMIYHYTSLNSTFFYFISGLVLFLYLITHVSVLFGYLKNNIGDFVYIIFYLCMVKLTPWVWFYLIVVETKL